MDAEPCEAAAKLLPDPEWREEPPYTAVAQCGPFKLGVFMQQERQVFGEREFEVVGPEGLVLRRGLGTTEEATRQSAYETANELASEVLSLADAIRAAGDGWVSVEAEWPACEQPLLVAFADGDVTTAFRLHSQTRLIWSMNKTRHSITHWRPLPVPPRGSS